MSSSSATAAKSRKGSNFSSLHHDNQFCSLFCNQHSSSSTGTSDLLILILVLISGTFLLTSYLSYVFTSLSLILSPCRPAITPLSYVVGVLLSFYALCRVAACFRVRKCGNSNSKRPKKALEFDLQLQTEDSLKNITHLVSASKPNHNINGDNINCNNNHTQLQVIDINNLPWMF